MDLLSFSLIKGCTGLMKYKYYVNKNPQKVEDNHEEGGDHEVHREDCRYLPKSKNRIYLGEFTNCFDAVKAARKYYKKVDGCCLCSPLCNTDLPCD